MDWWIEGGHVVSRFSFEHWYSCILQAPDVPGRYVSFWKLRDEQNSEFGLNLWIEYDQILFPQVYAWLIFSSSITVVELNNRSESTSEDSLASSSIVMPQSAPVRSAAPSDVVTEEKGVATSTISLSPVTAPSKPASEIGSDSDSVSLMSVPSSEDDDEFAWEDSRLHAEEGRSAMEYVVLYDDSSSEEEIWLASLQQTVLVQY
jgi:next-to-BRCA1 protein 1